MVGKIKQFFCTDQFNQKSFPISEPIHLYTVLSSVTPIDHTLANTHLLIKYSNWTVTSDFFLVPICMRCMYLLVRSVLIVCTLV